MLELIDRLPWTLAIILCLTLGLAPFTPPHLFEKLAMLARDVLHATDSGLRDGARGIVRS